MKPWEKWEIILLKLPKFVAYFAESSLFMESIVEQLLQSPKLPMYLDQLQAVLNDEKQRRAAFYEYIDENQKAEFINGEIVIHSPVMKRHNGATGRLYQLMNVHVAIHHLGFVGVEKIMIALTRNDYEPDICFFSESKAQHFTEDQKLFPTPDWVVEVLSGSTEKKDRGVKFEDYEAHGVSEYWLVDPRTQVVEQYLLQEGKYQLHLKSDNGFVSSRAMTGFEIPIQAIFDDSANADALQSILNKRK